MTIVDTRNISQHTATKKLDVAMGGHLSSDKIQPVKSVQSTSINSKYIDLTAGAMFVVTPDGIMHRQDSDGQYMPAITIKSYNMAASLNSSNDNSN